MHIRNDKGDLWTKSANYHSRTPRYNAVYRADLIRKASKWAEWLEARFVTLDVTKEGVTALMPTKVQEVAQQVSATPAKSRRTTMVQSTAVSSYVPRQIIFNDNPTRTE